MESPFTSSLVSGDWSFSSSASSSTSSSALESPSRVTFTFGEGPLGMTISTDRVISQIVPDSQAFRSGVSVGLRVMALNGKDISTVSYEEMLSQIRACPRPLTITFEKTPSAGSPSSAPAAASEKTPPSAILGSNIMSSFAALASSFPSRLSGRFGALSLTPSTASASSPPSSTPGVGGQSLTLPPTVNTDSSSSSDATIAAPPESASPRGEAAAASLAGDAVTGAGESTSLSSATAGTTGALRLRRATDIAKSASDLFVGFLATSSAVLSAVDRAIDKTLDENTKVSS
jgi:hypothetical protein